MGNKLTIPSGVLNPQDAVLQSLQSCNHRDAIPSFQAARSGDGGMREAFEEAS